MIPWLRGISLILQYISLVNIVVVLFLKFIKSIFLHANITFTLCEWDFLQLVFIHLHEWYNVSSLDIMEYMFALQMQICVTNLHIILLKESRYYSISLKKYIKNKLVEILLEFNCIHNFTYSSQVHLLAIVKNYLCAITGFFFYFST